MYSSWVKKRDLEKRLTQLGWWLTREGGSYEIWSNGEHNVPVPRHKEINELTARGILRKAEKNPIKQ